MIVTRFRYNKKLYTLEELRRLPEFKSVLFGSNPSYEELKNFGIEREETEIMGIDDDPSKMITLNDMKRKKRDELEKWYNAAINSLNVGYNFYEINTFEKQYRGALNIMDRNSYSEEAKFVIELYCSRNNILEPEGTDKLKDYCRKIIKKHNDYNIKESHILGIYKKLSDTIDNAKNYSDLEKIDFLKITF